MPRWNPGNGYLVSVRWKFEPASNPNSMNTAIPTSDEIDRLHHAISGWQYHPIAYPILCKYGYMERSQNGFVAIDPEATVRRCRQLIAMASIQPNHFTP